jgi:hypothetical protein
LALNKSLIASIKKVYKLGTFNLGAKLVKISLFRRFFVQIIYYPHKNNIGYPGC